MKIQQNNSAVETSGLNNVQDFKIAVNGKAFRILLDGIYPNKIKAVIRELCTNAFDAHSAAGKRHIPFDVTLPSTFNPVFKVRDYGVSMSHDQVMHLYSTLFQSSKENTNTEVGMLGLGSKAPFAYVDAFTTTAWMNSKKRTYRAWMGDNGVPKIALLGEEDSNEQQGIEVAIDVDPKDVKTFLTTAGDILKYFITKPNFLNNPIQIEDDTVTLSGNGWYLTEGYDGAVARQGCVVYPIDKSAIPNLSPDQESMLLSPFVIDFPIGTLDVAPSREELSYGPTTCANIIARLNTIAQEVSTTYKAEIDKAKTEWEASKIFLDLSRSGLPRSVVKILSNYTWNGTWKVDQTISLQDAYNAAKAIDSNFELHYYDIYTTRARLDLTVSSAQEFRYRKVAAGEPVDIYVRTDLENKPTYESMRLAQSRTSGPVLFLLTENQAAIDVFIKFLGNPTYRHTKDLPAAVIKRNAPTNSTGKTKKTEIKVRHITGFGKTANVTNEFILPLDGEAYFIETKNGKPTKFDGLVKGDYFDSLYKSLACDLGAAKDLNMFDATLNVYFVSTLYIDRVKEYGKWIDLNDHILAGLKTFKDSYIRHKVSEEIDRALSSNYNSYNSGNINEFVSNRFLYQYAQSNPDSHLAKVFAKKQVVVDTLKAAKNANSATGFNYSAFYKVYNLLGYSCTQSMMSDWQEEAIKIVSANLVDSSQLRKELLDIYPLLQDTNPRNWPTTTGNRYTDYIRSMDELHALRKFVSEVNNLRNVTGDGLDATFFVAAAE